MTEILITGGAGNFGRAVAGALHRRGHSLRVYDLPSCDFSIFQGLKKIRIFKADILDPVAMRQALDGAQMVFHLAAILPPVSEENRDTTFQVNVEGTRILVEACEASAEITRLIFASSVSVYGDTAQKTEIIGADHPVNPFDVYAESKVEAERILKASGIPYLNLRISGIAIPAFLDPPEPWPFTKNQRIELLALEDLVSAMANLVNIEKTENQTLILAGGKTWQVSGEEYVRRWGEIMEIPLEEMSFRDHPGWLNWYDTDKSQSLFNYQNTSLEDFYAKLKTAVEEALA